MTNSNATAWAAVESDGRDGRLGQTEMRELFRADPERAARYSLSAAGLFLDYSKNRIDDDAFAKLFSLARASDLEARRDAMFAGAHINLTENRSVLHTALRDMTSATLNVDGSEILGPIREVRGRAYAFAERIRAGTWLGCTGKTISHVVNIGIGGSDLGPRMVCGALHAFSHPRMKFHFVANIDGAALADVLDEVDIERTLFIIASKTFTTIETLTNAHSARKFFLASGGTEAGIAKHFVAVSTNTREVTAFGIDPDNMFPFWDWVGGRYSLWSSIGLSIMIAIGGDKFDELLGGAHAMDRHFRDAPLEKNMPVIMALLGIWYRNAFRASSMAVLPYAEHLQRLPSYLQQLDMESNGKSVTLDGMDSTRSTGPVIWGEPGTNGQHAFFQLLHQGTELVPIDFILPVHPTHDLAEHHALLVANCLAQSAALMAGKTSADVKAEMLAAGASAGDAERLSSHRRFSGNRPSNTILLDRLDPFSLGALIALYEHKVFVQGVIWNVNSFDQWGVELGKVVATSIGKSMSSPANAGADEKFDASTQQLLARCRARA